MNNFKFVNLTELNNLHIIEVAQLLLETGYYEYISQNNKLGLSPAHFQKIQTLKPYAPYAHVLIDVNDEIAGFFIAATKQQIKKVEKNLKNWYHNTTEIKDILEKLTHFYVDDSLETDFILYGVAVTSKWRGRGLFKVLYNEQVRLAKQKFCSRIIFVVWKSNPALNIYLNYGAKIIGEFDFTNSWFKDKLIKCYFEL